MDGPANKTVLQHVAVTLRRRGFGPELVALYTPRMHEECVREFGAAIEATLEFMDWMCVQERKRLRRANGGIVAHWREDVAKYMASYVPKTPYTLAVAHGREPWRGKHKRRFK